SVTVTTRSRSRERYELLYVFRGQRRMHHEHQRRYGYQRDRGKVLDRIVSKIAGKACGDRVRTRIPLQNRISVRRRVRDYLGSKRASSPAAIVRYHLLTKAFRQLLRDDASHDVVGTADRERDQIAH